MFLRFLIDASSLRILYHYFHFHDCDFVINMRHVLIIEIFFTKKNMWVTKKLSIFSFDQNLISIDSNVSDNFFFPPHSTRLLYRNKIDSLRACWNLLVTTNILVMICGLFLALLTAHGSVNRIACKVKSFWKQVNANSGIRRKVPLCDRFLILPIPWEMEK